MATLDRPVLASDKATLQARQAECRRLLIPMSAISDRERIGGLLAHLFSGYANTASLSPSQMIAAYISKLSELPAWSIEETIHDVERGRVDGLSPDFPPSAARLFQIADAKVAEIKTEKQKIDTIISARVATEKPGPSQEERERVAVKFKELKKQMDAAAYDKHQAEKEKVARLESEKLKAQREEHARRMEYILQGFEPPTNKHGITISMSLAMSTGMVLTKRRPAPPPKYEFSPEDTER